MLLLTLSGSAARATAPPWRPGARRESPLEVVGGEQDRKMGGCCQFQFTHVSSVRTTQSSAWSRKQDSSRRALRHHPCPRGAGAACGVALPGPTVSDARECLPWLLSPFHAGRAVVAASIFPISMAVCTHVTLAHARPHLLVITFFREYRVSSA